MTLPLSAIWAGPLPGPDLLARGWSVDTRTLEPGDLFFALRGPRHDGHRYVSLALEKGAAGAMVDRQVESVAGRHNVWLVEDVLTTLQCLAARARERWGGTVVGVTGSAGKTTTKDAVAHLLGAALKTGKTVGNFNNHVGVPLSILRLPDDCRAAVLEIGMNHAGEIRALAAIARPHIGVVTNVGYAHVENFDSLEGVAGAKRELIESLPPGGVAVLNADDPRVSRFGERHRGRTLTYGFSETAAVRADDVRCDSDATRFRALGVEFETALSGRHNILNLLAAIAVAGVFQIPPDRLRDAVRTFTCGQMRGERLEHHGAIVWNDCYNSNPEAARAMLDVLRATPARRRIAVLGEMLELGHSAEALHRGVGNYAVRGGIDVLIGIRGAARYMVEAAMEAGLSDSAASFFDDPAPAGDYLRQLVRPGDAILFKGSRGVQVERALERFLQ